MRVFWCAMILMVATAAWAAEKPTDQGVEQIEAHSGAMDTEAPVAVPPPSEEAIRYYRTGVAWWLFYTFWGIALPAVIVFSGFSATLRNVAQRIGRNWFFTIAVYWVLFLLVMYAVSLPLSFYSGYVRQHAYGLSNQTFLKWFTDSLISRGVLAAIGCLFLWVPFLLLKRSPKRWWLYTGLLMVPFIALMMFVMPIWIDPLFNTFGPMKDKDLERKILDVAESAGIEGSRVYEVDMSVDTNAINAYVTGFLDTKRIVLWDTIIAKLDEDELLFVMAHEMGHYVLGHVVKGILLSSALILVGLYIAHRMMNGLVRRYSGRFGFDRISDVASIPLFLAVFSIVSLVLEPVGLAYSRHIERESDRFGLELTQDNRIAAEAFVKLYSENLGYPDPGWLMTVLRSSHPSIADRVGFCNTYRPWETGAPQRYGHLFERGRASEPESANNS